MLIVVEDATNHKYFINTVDGMFLLEIIYIVIYGGREIFHDHRRWNVYLEIIWWW